MSHTVSLVRGHQGKLLINTADDYPTLLQVIKEGVQNGIDGNGKNISVVVNERSRNITIRDDGDGVTQQKMDASLVSIADSDKEEDKIGEFGIGFISPLGKCVRFTFTSTPRDGDGTYRRWSFVTEDIRRMAEEVTVPMEVVSNLRFGPTDKSLTLPKVGKVQQVTWRSMLRIESYTRDKKVSRIGTAESLAKEIFADFRLPMLQRKVKLHIRITDQNGKVDELTNLTPPKFTGQPLDREVIKHEGKGFTSFALFLAPRDLKGKAKGQVMVGVTSRSFRFGFDKFVKAHGEDLDDDAVAALRSGMFEGYITCSEVVLHRDRDKFMIGDEVVRFCDSINQWYEETGSVYVERVTESQKNERYQRLTAAALESFIEQLDSPEYEEVRELLEMVNRTSEGLGGKAKVKEVVVDTEPVYPASDPHPGPDVPDEPSPEPIVPRPRRPKVSVLGPEGDQAQTVQSKRFGLQIACTEFFGRDELWFFEEDRWTLALNTLHPIWVKCDENKSDRRVMQLIELILVYALDWVMLAKSEQDLYRDFYDRLIDRQVKMLLVSPSFNPHRKLRVVK